MGGQHLLEGSLVSHWSQIKDGGKTTAAKNLASPHVCIYIYTQARRIILPELAEDFLNVCTYV